MTKKNNSETVYKPGSEVIVDMLVEHDVEVMFGEY
jgi:hypothetical protein